MSDWSFNHRTRTSDLSSDSGSNEGEGLSNEMHLLDEMDLSSREENVDFRANPWSIAKINAGICATSQLKSKRETPNIPQTATNGSTEAVSTHRMRRPANLKPPLVKTTAKGPSIHLSGGPSGNVKQQVSMIDNSIMDRKTMFGQPRIGASNPKIASLHNKHPVARLVAYRLPADRILQSTSYTKRDTLISPCSPVHSQIRPSSPSATASVVSSVGGNSDRGSHHVMVGKMTHLQNLAHGGVTHWEVLHSPLTPPLKLHTPTDRGSPGSSDASFLPTPPYRRKETRSDFQHKAQFLPDQCTARGPNVANMSLRTLATNANWNTQQSSLQDSAARVNQLAPPLQMQVHQNQPFSASPPCHGTPRHTVALVSRMSQTIHHMDGRLRKAVNPAFPPALKTACDIPHTRISSTVSQSFNTSTLPDTQGNLHSGSHMIKDLSQNHSVNNNVRSADRSPRTWQIQSAAPPAIPSTQAKKRRLLVASQTVTPSPRGRLSSAYQFGNDDDPDVSWSTLFVKTNNPGLTRGAHKGRKTALNHTAQVKRSGVFKLPGIGPGRKEGTSEAECMNVTEQELERKTRVITYLPPPLMAFNPDHRAEVTCTNRSWTVGPQCNGNVDKVVDTPSTSVNRIMTQHGVQGIGDGDVKAKTGASDYDNLVVPQLDSDEGTLIGENDQYSSPVTFNLKDTCARYPDRKARARK